LDNAASLFPHPLSENTMDTTSMKEIMFFFKILPPNLNLFHLYNLA